MKADKIHPSYEIKSKYKIKKVEKRYRSRKTREGNNIEK